MCSSYRKTVEDEINSFPNYTTEIEGITLHFVAMFSEKQDAVPILLSHGWPGSCSFSLSYHSIPTILCASSILATLEIVTD